MVDGTDQAKGFAKSHGAYLGSGAATAIGQTAMRSAEPSKPIQRNVMESARQARVVGSALDEHAKAMFGLAERAEMIATNLAGSFPCPGPSEEARGGEGGRVGPGSAIGVLDEAIEDLKPRVNVLHDPYSRIANALDVIERAIS